MNQPAVAVIGGGIAGLSAAWELTRATPTTRVVVVEGAPELGGKIRTEDFDGIPVDTGPDSFLARVPAAVELAREAGLGDELVAPGTGQAYLWSGGHLRALPTGLVLGVPTDPAALARSGVVGRRAAARAALDAVLPGSPVGPADDVSVGGLVRRRMGRDVQMRLVDPLLGGINAGHTDHLSAAVAAPQLLAAARRNRSLVAGLRATGTSGTASGAIAPAGEAPAAPVFLTVRGGLGRLVEAVAAGLSGAVDTVLGDAAVAITRSDDGRWTVRLHSGRIVSVDAVVLATPPAATAALLEPLSPAGAGVFATMDTSSVALTVLSYPRSAFPGPLIGSGFLVPRAEGRLMTACSWVGPKWPHLDQPDRVMLRVSAGRTDDTRAAELDDAELVGRLHAELVAAMGVSAPPGASAVHRWPGAFPQYEVGHLDRIARAEERLAHDAPGIHLAGAPLRGVGIATIVAGARAAARAATASAARTGAAGGPRPDARSD